ncbi:MAG: cation:proton antiporter [Lactimicrobium massiliense]|nr:cation:proton antiporter [Lactimicrobium massiliense]MDD6230048.1 cation:proton antiporter [Lactimicrobium massiliense]
MILNILRWILTLILAVLTGKAMQKLKMPAILGWLIAGMTLGPHALNLLPQKLLDTALYQTIIIWMQCSFGLMLGTELVWRRVKKYGRALMITTLTQSLGTFLFVSAMFAILFVFMHIPIYLAFAFGGIALATAPAPALAIVQEFHTKGPVTSTLLPMAVLDDIVGIAVFFTVDSCIARAVSGGALPLYMIPVMIFLPILIGICTGLATGKILKQSHDKKSTLAILLIGVTATAAMGLLFNKLVFTTITLNYMLMGVSFSATFSNMVDDETLNHITAWYNNVLSVSLVTAIVDLGAPLDYHLIIGAGVTTFLYIASRAFGKYFGARIGATATHMPKTVQKYLGLTLLPHSGVSLVFTGIICATLQASRPDLASLVKGTIAAAAVINEIIAVFAARKGFQLAGEMHKA